MTEKKLYNKFIQHPSNSNILINVSIIVGFSLLIISQILLSRAMTQQQSRASASSTTDVSGNAENSSVILTSSDIQLVSCSDDDLINAVALVKPAIVNIDVVSSDVGGSSQRGGPALSFDVPPGQALVSNEETLGSGILIDEKGYILTCYHLIKDNPRVYVTVFAAGRQIYEAEIAGVDAAENLAVLKINPKTNLPAAKLGNSGMVAITDTVLTIGSPFGFEHTVTAGIISDNNRSIIIDGVVYDDLFQTDAAVNRGNAGGALINTEGEVIGINIAIASSSEYFSGVSFAIPINKARSLLFKTVEY